MPAPTLDSDLIAQASARDLTKISQRQEGDDWELMQRKHRVVDGYKNGMFDLIDYIVVSGVQVQDPGQFIPKMASLLKYFFNKGKINDTLVGCYFKHALEHDDFVLIRVISILPMEMTIGIMSDSYDEALFRSAKLGDADCANALLDAGADATIPYGQHNRTAYHYLVINGMGDVAKRVANSRNSKAARDHLGRFPLDYARTANKVELFASLTASDSKSAHIQASLELLEPLEPAELQKNLEAGASYRWVDEKDDCVAHKAVHRDSRRTLTTLFEKFGSQVLTFKNMQGETPGVLAARTHQNQALQTILELCPPLGWHLVSYYSEIFLAVVKSNNVAGSAIILPMLLNTSGKGRPFMSVIEEAIIHVLNRKEWRTCSSMMDQLPMKFCRSLNKRDSRYDSDLNKAVDLGLFTACEAKEEALSCRLLTMGGGFADMPAGAKRTAYHVATELGLTDLLQQMRGKKSPSDVYDWYGLTPLDTALCSDSLDRYLLLKKKKKSSKSVQSALLLLRAVSNEMLPEILSELTRGSEPRVCDPEGNSCGHLMILRNNTNTTPILGILLSYLPCSYKQRNRQGKDWIEFAASLGHWDLVAFILERVKSNEYLERGYTCEVVDAMEAGAENVVSLFCERIDPSVAAKPSHDHNLKLALQKASHKDSGQCAMSIFRLLYKSAMTHRQSFLFQLQYLLKVVLDNLVIAVNEKSMNVVARLVVVIKYKGLRFHLPHYSQYVCKLLDLCRESQQREMLGAIAGVLEVTAVRSYMRARHISGPTARILLDCVTEYSQAKHFAHYRTACIAFASAAKGQTDFTKNSIYALTENLLLYCADFLRPKSVRASIHLLIQAEVKGEEVKEDESDAKSTQVTTVALLPPSDPTPSVGRSSKRLGSS